MAPAVAASEKETAVTSTSSLTVSPTDQTALALPGGKLNLYRICTYGHNCWMLILHVLLLSFFRYILFSKF